jgi:hypothetical protein
MVRIRFDKEEGEWYEIPKENPKTDMDIVMDNKLCEVLIAIKKDLKRELDHAMLVGGSVGSGKSNAARVMCRFVSDEKFHPRTHIIRDVDDIEPVITNARPGEAIIFDEGSGIFSATDTMTKKTKYANYVLDVCRQKFLFIVIVAPDIHRLTSKIAIDRTKTFVRVYMDNKTGRRGKFAFYGTRLKEKLYRFAKKNYGVIKGCKAKFRGTIGLDKTYTSEYKQVKDETLTKALQSFGKKKEAEKALPKPKKVIHDYRLSLVAKNRDKTSKELANLLELSESSIKQYRKQIEDKAIALLNEQTPNITAIS